MVQEHIGAVRESLPHGYYRELPELAAGPLAGYPRVYELLITLISHTEGRITLDRVRGFVAAFQKVAALTIGELWAVPAMLRLGLLENVRRMALRTVQRLDELREADAAAARIVRAAESDPEALDAALHRFATQPHSLSPTFLSRFLHQLRLEGGALPAVVRLEQWIAEEAHSGEAATAGATQRLAQTQVAMANSITSLRAIARMDWRDFVEDQSRVESVLREDPSGFYPRMTFATRDRYRHVVERVARRTDRSEDSVARLALDLARAGQRDPSHPTDQRRGHVGFYLIDAGQVELERAAGYRPPVREALHRWVRRHPNVVFVGGVLLATLAALAAVLWLGGLPPPSVWPVLLLLGFIPATEIAVNIVNQLVTAFLPPRPLPKLDLHEHGVPPEFRTAVVIPTLFESVDAVQEALDNLEVQFLANREAHLHFAVLSDFTDSPTEHREGDAAILAAAVAGVTVLNARYAADSLDGFYLFHRPRRWNPAEGVWMGWERKRGKLAEFNRFVLGGSDEAFTTVIGDVAPIRQVRYVITLDADTLLPPDAAPLLVGALAHPLNHAVYDPDKGRVVRGYGILQPRVGVSVPSANRSVFAAIHSGHPGVDPYTTAVSDVYQDLYGEGSFTGKGVYDVAAFEQATHGRFPENTLLSHDLIEGSYARAGLATDVIVYDDYPSHYLSFTRRKHRWIRGDWQLLPWLTGRVPGPDGAERNRLSLLSRWKIVDNLRRSIVELAQLAFLLAGWTFLPGSPLRWTLLGIGAVAAPWIVALLLAVVRAPLDKSWRAYYAALGRELRTSAEQVALALAFLPHQAWISADAIGRTLWRLLVSRRRLLQWRTASQAERNTSNSARALWSAMAPAVVIGGFAFLAATGNGLAVLPFALLWMVSPLLANRLGAPIARREQHLGPAQRDQAIRYAGLHWSYFDKFVTAETNWLAPDNFQEDPAPVVAMRTSPTNIGLQLLAITSARDLGFITLEEMIRRLELAFGSLRRMRRFRGHFYNWYDLRDLSVLEPAYLSTVDSGNLAGHLIALRQACLEIMDEPGAQPSAPRLQAIAEEAYGFAMEMDFGFLFDADRKLFSIGFQETAHALDESYYDLLASEARLASFIAVAKNDVPLEHWFLLGRTLTYAAGRPVLVSWSGSMFEYLMPLLIMRSYPLTLLGESCAGAVRRQMAYGGEHGVPWGVSESAYNLRDRHHTYQYRAFGVPDLALKRGLDRELVIAPYASALAVLVDPERALANLASLERHGALGPYGFRDALDYTRPDPGQPFALARVYLAHHIGMSLVALVNLLGGNRWQRRFHADPLVRATSLLLHERIPRRVLLREPSPIRSERTPPAAGADQPVVRQVDTPDTPQPQIALLGQLPYTIMVSHCGGGYSRYESLAVTRWRSDGTRDATGQFCYVKNLSDGRVWSAAHQPVCARADWYHASLATDRVTFHRGDGRIETRTEIAVVPEDSAEVRRVTVTNNDDQTHEIELTSYGEIVLAPPDADREHPAFGNLFVETEWHEWCSAITATRRPRSAEERSLWCVHVAATGQELIGPVTCETDRARFLGRGRSLREPAVLRTDGALSGTTGAVLDPIFALRTRIRLGPRQSTTVAFTTLVATSRERAFELADRYHDPYTAQRALDLAWTSSQVELRELGLTPADAALFQELAGHLFYGNPALRIPHAERLENRGSQPLLWATGVSGDWPILLATIESTEGLPTLRQLLAAHRYWHRRGMTVDLVILNAQTASYLQDLNDRVMAAVYSLSDSGSVDRPGGVFVRRSDLLGAEELLMLRATARVYMPCDRGSLGRFLTESTVPPEPAPDLDDALPAEFRSPERRGLRVGGVLGHIGTRLPALLAPLVAPVSAAFRQRLEPGSDPAPAVPANGFGSLNADGDYEIEVCGDRIPPAPWSNVIANRHGGFVVTERGGGCTWAGNSYFYRLTPWHNDPVNDPISEIVYLQDAETGKLWCATPGPLREEVPYAIRHKPGASTFAHERDRIATHLTLGMAEDAPVKLAVLRITNRDTRPRRLTLTTYLEWTLGVHREFTQHQVHTTFDREHSGIFAQNTFDPEFADWMAFHAISEPVIGYTAGRRGFLGRNGDVSAPAALLAGGVLKGTTGVGIDPCAALQCRVELAAGETREVVIVIGAAASETAARNAVAEYRGVGRARAALAGSVAAWTSRLSVITVRTPEPSFDAMLNRWTLYQALACRLWARSALYQSSGAYGFRDQLQDVMALVYAEPALAREHILRAAARQFVEGDVQHWWHPSSGRGLRTRCSDDLAWLPYVVAHYVRTTGDASVLDETVPFLTMRPLAPGESEVYDLPQVSTESATLYQHCVRALWRAPAPPERMGCR